MLAAACLLAGPGALGQEPEPPPFYAVTNVTVVRADGAPLEGMTVLLADGLIEAVGADIPVPAYAWVVDGEGLRLFPGLIDSLTAIGRKQEEGGGPGGRGGAGEPGRGAPEIRGPEDRPQTTPWVAAADELEDDPRIEKWRKAGFTGAVTAPTDGYFAGQAALLNLGGAAEMKQTVVATPVAQRLNFRARGGFRSYPGSLMGSLAYIDQVLIDARYAMTVEAAYAAAPLGRERPTYDRTLGPLELALADGLPFLLPADSAKEIDRALRLARDHDLHAILYGGQGAYDRVDRIRKADAAVVVSLKWPEEEKNRDPDADTSFATLYHRRLAPTTPAKLSAAGVPMGFSSEGLGSPSEIFASIRAAVDAGLSNEAALAALTTGPARIYGVADRLGRIEPGMIANLILASDWPWAEGAEVRAVFVDGRKYEERRSDEPTEPPASDVSGTWKITMTTPRGTQEMTAEVGMAEDGKVTGEVTGERGTTKLEEGRMSGNVLSFKTTRSMGSRTMTASWSLVVEEDGLAGTMSAGPMSMEISGERTARKEPGAAAGEKEAEEPAVSLAEMDAVRALYQGPVERNGTFAITNATVWTLAGPTIPNGTVVVENGKIAAVGADLPAPEGIRVIDAGGGQLIPGIIDAHSHIAIEGGVNEGTLAVTAMVSIGDVVDPDDIAIYRALAGGVTSANLLHGSANSIGGQNQVIKLRWGADADGLRFEGAPPGIKFALGENPKRSNFRSSSVPARYPQTRMGVMDVIHQAFTEAREYQKQWQEYDAAVAARGKGKKATGPEPIPPRRDRKLEALVEVLEGRRLVHSHCYRADEILQLLRLAEEFGFQIATLQHVLEGYKVADEIAAHGAGASTFSDWWGYKVEAYDAIPYNAALMTERGVVVSINSDSGEEMRHLNQEAGKMMKWGDLDEIEALKLVTLNPAKQLHIDDRVGSIEVGKDADLVLYDGDPLSITSFVQKTWVDGDLYFDIDADRERQARIDDVKEKLSPEKKEDGEQKGQEEDAPEPGEVSSEDPTWDDVRYSCREDG